MPASDADANANTQEMGATTATDGDKDLLIDFERSGPKSTAADDTPEARRILMACLVNATYIHEIRRQRGAAAPAEPPSRWHTAFGYRVEALLHSRTHAPLLVGAVFVWSRTTARALWRPRGARPAAVVALRGTIVSSASALADTAADAHVAVHGAGSLSRTAAALDAARAAVRRFGAANVALAGHSLGAAVALHVGRVLAAEGALVDAHLFNPPLPSVAPVRDAAVGAALYSARGFLAALLPAQAENKAEAEAEAEAEAALAAWCPNVYVNMGDPFSCAYAHYLRSRGRRGPGDERSVTAALLNLAGCVAEPLHVLPTVKLFVNSGAAGDGFGTAHGLHQWWCQDVDLVVEHHALLHRHESPPPSSST